MIDIGRYRYRILKIDLAPWLNYTCPVCEQGFTENPRLYFMSYAVHFECFDSNKGREWEQKMHDLYNEENE